MKEMTRKEFLSLSSRAAIAAPILCFGCRATTPGTVPAWIEVASIIAQNAVAVGVAMDLQAHPEHRIPFQIAESALTGMVDRQNWNAADFVAILKALPVTYFQGPNGVLVVTTIASVFDLASGTWLDVSTAPAVERVMRSVRDGLRAGLQSTQTTTRSLKTVKPIKIAANAPRIKI